MTDTLFEKEPGPAPVEDKDYLVELVGEGKRYKTPQDLAKAAVEKDRFIDHLTKNELAPLREELKKRMTIEEFMTKMEASRTTQTPSNVDTNPREPVSTNTDTLTPEQLERILDQKMAQRDASRVAENNRSAVRQKLKEVYGEQFPAKLRQEAAKLGIGEAFLDEVATKSPEAFYQLLGLNSTRTPVRDIAPPQSERTTFTPAATGRDYKFYQDLRTKMGSGAFFADMKVQNQMFQDLKAQGEADFYKDYIR